MQDPSPHSERDLHGWPNRVDRLLVTISTLSYHISAEFNIYIQTLLTITVQARIFFINPRMSGMIFHRLNIRHYMA